MIYKMQIVQTRDVDIIATSMEKAAGYVREMINSGDASVEMGDAVINCYSAVLEEEYENEST